MELQSVAQLKELLVSFQISYSKFHIQANSYIAVILCVSIRPQDATGSRGGRYMSRNIVGHQYRGFFGISLYIYFISTTSAGRFLDGVVLMACSMAALSLTLYCKQTDQKLTPS